MKNEIIEVLTDCMKKNDMELLEQVLQNWLDPDPEIILELLDTCGGDPRVSAVLLEYLHRSFTPESLQKARKLQAEEALCFIDEDEDDLSARFTWETFPDGCRILSYEGNDHEILIPEKIGNAPVSEISRLFFLTCSSAESLLVPEGIRVGTLKPKEARRLFGAELCTPEIIRIPREYRDSFSCRLNTGSSKTESFSAITRPNTLNKASSLHPGDPVFFGRWLNETDGTEAPLEWIVLKEQDSCILLVSRHITDRLPWHAFRTGVLWDSCDLRIWLNTAFYDAAFSEVEQKRIFPVTITGNPNPSFGTRNRFASEDRVFLPDPEEWKSFRSLRIHTDSSKKQRCSLWLRMPGLTAQYAVTADCTGRVNWHGELVAEPGVGVLPAMWIKL